MYEAIGTVCKVMPEKTVGAKNFVKREFVIETYENPRYPQKILFESSGERMRHLDGLNIGDEVKVTFDLRGREVAAKGGGEERYFGSNDIVRVDVIKRASAPSEGFGGGDAAPGGVAADDIPFASASLHDEPSPIASVLR